MAGSHVFLLFWWVVAWMFSAPTTLLILGQKGFISIDCGAQSDSHDSFLGIDYKADDEFIDSGDKMNVDSDFMYSGRRPTSYTLRTFPKGTRNCYTIPLIEATATDEVMSRKYLIRASFLYGNYDKLNNAPKFDLHLGVNYWATIDPLTLDQYHHEEIIYVVPPTSDAIQVCLVKTSYGHPFISSLELRQLSDTMYPAADQFQALVLFARNNYNDSDPHYSTVSRYPHDIYDRFWEVYDFGHSSIINSRLWDGSLNPDPLDRTDDKYKVPTRVLETAATVANSVSPLYPKWVPGTLDPAASNWIAYFHFAEMAQLSSPRQFEIYFNDIFVKTISLNYLEPLTVPTDKFTSVDGSFSYRLVSTSSSEGAAPPILNAFEIYYLLSLSTTPTFHNDVNALNDVKKAYNVTKDSWQGDPCVPTNLTWEGVTCNTDDPPRIISLNVSSSSLKGNIAHSIANLTSLQFLDLSHNSLNGSVPGFQATLPNLTILNLTGNKLSGSIPEDLQKKKANASILQLSVAENPDLCPTASCGSSKKTKKLRIVASVIAGFIAVVVVCILIIVQPWKERPEKNMATKRSQNMDQGNPNVETEEMKPEVGLQGISRDKMRFSKEEVARIIGSFTVEIGEGGSGKVFPGRLADGRLVAVKILSEAAKENTDQFETEVEVLLKVHHKNLVPLLGYCDDHGTMALIYEYQAKGNLRENLSGGNANLLTWKQRVSIAVDAVRGLDYLHHDCIPPIVHRDIKPENILLDEHFQAKISDFGLSRNFIGAIGSAIATDPVGTHYYLDPEYGTSKSLTKKTDVYSFGVVLLELITGRPVVESGIHIVDWAISEYGDPNFDLQVFVDPRLNSQYDQHSAIKLVKAAISCVEKTVRERPDIREVHMEIRGCLDSARDTSQRMESGSRVLNIRSPDKDERPPILHRSYTRSTSTPKFLSAQGNHRRGVD